MVPVPLVPLVRLQEKSPHLWEPQLLPVSNWDSTALTGSGFRGSDKGRYRKAAPCEAVGGVQNGRKKQPLGPLSFKACGAHARTGSFSGTVGGAADAGREPLVSRWFCSSHCPVWCLLVTVAVFQVLSSHHSGQSSSGTRPSLQGVLL